MKLKDELKQCCSQCGEMAVKAYFRKCRVCGVEICKECDDTYDWCYYCGTRQED